MRDPKTCEIAVTEALNASGDFLCPPTFLAASVALTGLSGGRALSPTGRSRPVAVMGDRSGWYGGSRRGRAARKDGSGAPSRNWESDRFVVLMKTVEGNETRLPRCAEA